jgi:iron-sulfur cluster protein
MKKDFKTEVDDALHNPNIALALGRFSEAYPIAREQAYDGIQFETLRKRVAETKAYAAEHMEELAEQFRKAAEARGAKVFRSRSPQHIKEYILNLAKEKGVKKIVKSKSMASEEIHLNPYLREQGIQIDETDLGEWIIQLTGQKPSHMVLPAIHMTKEEISDVFSKTVNERISSEIPRLVKVARKELRQKFFAADMGISGGNIAIAETGSIVLVTNEGNAELVTTLPKIHIALVGLEKLIATYDDIVPYITALPKSATCQKMTSYVTMITGPTPNDDGTMKELHIILMDNQRSEMARDPKFKQALQCIRCASCLSVCPVYRLVGGLVYGHVYMGGIGTILTAMFNDLETSKNIQSLCIQCGKCKEICPGNIDIPELILEVRRRLADKQGLPFIQKTVLSVINNRKLFHTMLRAAYLAQAPFAKEGYIRHLPMFLSGLSEHRSLPTIAPVPFRDIFKKIDQPKSKLKAAFFSGCAIDFMFPKIGEDVVTVLNKAGIEVIYPEAQSCCGIPHWGSGAFDMAADAAEHNIKALLENDVQYVVTACASCASALKIKFAEVLKDGSRHDMVHAAEKLAKKTFVFSELVDKLVKEEKLKLKTGLKQSVTYHDSCHAKRHVGISKEPRNVLKECGYELNELFECDTCCGMGGSYTVKQPELSMRMLQRKLNNIQATGADFIAMECPGCLIQIGGGLDKTEAKIKTKHIAALIADRCK